MHARLVTCLAICSALLCVGAAAASSNAKNYYIFPIDYKTGITPRSRGLLEAGKVPVGGSVRAGYFYAVLPLGSPPKLFDVIVDTGSTVTYVPCNDCAHCGTHKDAPFNPSQSATSSWVQCSDTHCQQQQGVYYCDNHDSANHCIYRISYAEQSSSEGRLVRDVFTFPDNVTKVPITFGCESGETGEIYKQKPDGLVGMGNSPAAFHSQLAAAGAIPHVFSLCFGFPSGGALLLGNAPIPGSPSFSWTALSASGWGDFFAVSLDHITYGAKTLDIPKATFRSGYRTVLDSGTTFIYLTTPAYTAFAAATKAAARASGLVQTMDGYGDTCWTGAASDFADLDKFFPVASLKFFGGGELRLHPYRYLFQLSRKGRGTGTYCMAVFDNGSAGALIGGVATRNVLVKYDIEAQRVGFADVDCHALGKMPAAKFNLAKQQTAPLTVEEEDKAAAGAAAGAAAAAAPTAAAGAAPAADQAAVAAAAASAADNTAAAVTQQQQQEEGKRQSSPSSSQSEEVSDEAYEEALSILDKAAQKAEAILAAATASPAPAAAAAVVAALKPSSTAAAAASATAEVPAAGVDGPAATPISPAAAAAAAPPTSAAAPSAAAVAPATSDEDAAPAIPYRTVTFTPSTGEQGEVPSEDQQEVPAAGLEVPIEDVNMTTTTAAVSEDLLVPSTPDSSSSSSSTALNGSSSSSSSSSSTALNGSSSSSSSSNATAAAVPAKVYWGTSSGEFSSTNLRSGIKSIMGETSPVLAVVLFVVLGALLLAAAGAVAIVLRRRQIKAAGFSQLSATEIDCELAGISRRPAGFSNGDGFVSSGGQQQQRYGSSGGSGTDATAGGAYTYNSRSGAVPGRNSGDTCSTGMGPMGPGVTGSRHAAAGLSVQPPEAAAAADQDIDAYGSSLGRDAVKSPDGRDQWSPKPAPLLGVSVDNNIAGVLPPLAQGAAAVPHPLLPPPRRQQRLQQAAAAASVHQQQQQQHAAVFSIDHDEEHDEHKADGAAAAGSTAAVAAAGSSSNSSGSSSSPGGGEGSRVLNTSLSSDSSMEFIDL